MFQRKEVYNFEKSEKIVHYLTILYILAHLLVNEMPLNLEKNLTHQTFDRGGSPVRLQPVLPVYIPQALFSAASCMVTLYACVVNPLTPTSDQYVTSLYNINTS